MQSVFASLLLLITVMLPTVSLYGKTKKTCKTIQFLNKDSYKRWVSIDVSFVLWNLLNFLTSACNLIFGVRKKFHSTPFYWLAQGRSETGLKA